MHFQFPKDRPLSNTEDDAILCLLEKIEATQLEADIDRTKALLDEAEAAIERAKAEREANPRHAKVRLFMGAGSPRDREALVLEEGDGDPKKGAERLGAEAQTLDAPVKAAKDAHLKAMGAHEDAVYAHDHFTRRSLLYLGQRQGFALCVRYMADASLRSETERHAVMADLSNRLLSKDLAHIDTLIAALSPAYFPWQANSHRCYADDGANTPAEESAAQAG